ncbi:MAG: NAD-dependent SIR2 family protein deacetylase [Gammaproteobacteria bacterium]|jgi:NAD-dependent SIR2 family protein deacetylase
MVSSILEFFQPHKNILVLTGAGVSTASGIPDYRDAAGTWKHSRPMQYQDFITSESSRRAYWLRSALGRERFKNASPNAAHTALAELERKGKISLLITQNVDGLHQRAGSRNVIDLHGSLDHVVCLDCGHRITRDEVQAYLYRHNPFLENLVAKPLPDGDTQFAQTDSSGLKFPQCHACGGVLKPELVFYGESVPAQRVTACFEALDRCDALLVVGSSLMVFSGYRFARHAHQNGIPVAAINRGLTRADDLLSLKIEDDCSRVLEDLVGQIGI